MSDDHESRRAARREEERQYRFDVEYEVWRSGGNMDLVDYYRVQDAFHAGADVSDAARSELRAQRPPPEPKMPEEEYYEQQQQPVEGE